MLTLEQLLNNKLVIYRLAEEWGFVVDINKNEVPRIFIDPFYANEKARVCLLVKPDPRIGNLEIQESVRRACLEQELSIQLNCNVSVDTENSLNDIVKDDILKEAVPLSGNHQAIIKYFGSNKTFESYDPVASEDSSLFEGDTLKNMEAMKMQIANKKLNFLGTNRVGFYVPLNSTQQHKNSISYEEINFLINSLKTAIKNIQSPEQKIEYKQRVINEIDSISVEENIPKLNYPVK